MPRSLAASLAAALALSLSAFGSAVAAEPAQASPNFLFILADDLGYGDLGCYGAPDIKTPNIDALAQRGVRLTSYYANAAVCTPTRAALMTGRYQQRIGGLEFAIYPGRTNLGLPATETVLPQILKDAGYSTAMSGKWHLGYDAPRSPIAHGFERFFGLKSGNHDYFTHVENNGQPDLFLGDTPIEEKGYSTDLIKHHAVEFLDSFPGGRPFFLYVAFNAPHFPYEGPGDEQRHPKGPKDGSREIYARMVEAMDGAIGQLLQRLEEKHFAQNTLVVFCSDNGGDTFARNLPFSGHKNTYREGGIRVPCIAVWPGRLPAGKTTDQPVITMDWTATMLALGRARPRPDRPLDGVNILPVLSGAEPEFDRPLFWRQRGPDGKIVGCAMRFGRWKYFHNRNGQEELFDLIADPVESRDVAASRPALVSSLRAQVDSWERSLVPPLSDQNPDQVTGWHDAASGNK